MWVNQIFSLITPVSETDNVVQNIIVCDNYEVANQIAKFNYGEFAFAVDTTQYPLSIGNIYRGGVFYIASYTDEQGVLHEEELVPRTPTVDEKVVLLEAKNIELNAQLADAQLSNLTAFEAIAEIYELLPVQP
ncbi:MAG: hypothetical protein K0R00_189 [Herbinix sp.]|jgi:hypothetical protein|nr:hypothetical protein [Herbinix sp.]